MSYTNSTEHYNIPLPSGTDKSLFTDWNTCASVIDAALYAAVTASNTHTTQINSIIAELTEISTALTQAGTDIDTLEAAVAEHAERLVQLANRITNLEGADIAYDGTDSGLTATNVQGAIDELAPSKDCVKIVEVTHSTLVSVNPNSHTTIDIDTFTPLANYTAIGVPRVSTGNTDLTIEQYTPGTVTVHNTTANARDAKPSMKIAYIKNSMIDTN